MPPYPTLVSSYVPMDFPARARLETIAAKEDAAVAGYRKTPGRRTHLHVWAPLYTPLT